MGKANHEEKFYYEVQNENRIVSGWLLFYHERKKEYEQQRDDILNHSGASEYDGQPRGTETSDTTGRKGQKLADLEHAERWLKLVEEVERDLPWKMGVFLHLRREYRYQARGRKGWLNQIQQRYCFEVAERLKKQPEDVWIGNVRTFQQWWDKIIMYATIKAAKKGLLK